MIVADDMGWGDAGCYGGAIETPHIDRLAAEGMRFTDFYVSAPVCQPSRVALLSGRHQLRAGEFVRNVQPRPEQLGWIRASMSRLPGTLQRAGYTTGLIGKWGVASRTPATPLECGYQTFAGYLGGVLDHVAHVDRRGKPDWWVGPERVVEEGYLTHLITGHATRFIEQNADRRFFLCVSHAVPHQPFQLPGDEPVFRLDEGGEWVERDRDPAELRAIHAAMIGQLDDAVGALLEAIEAAGLTQETLVVFLSDNGATAAGSNGPLRAGKDTLWEGGIRSPALFRWPGQIAAGEVADDMASALDLAPSLLELAGVGAFGPKAFDGVSLVRRLIQGHRLPARDLFWEHQVRNGPLQQAMRRGPLKLVMQGDEAELYDLSADPAETRDLAADRPEDVQQLRTAWQAWRDGVGAPVR